MEGYQRILCAVDLTEDSRAVLARAAALAAQWRAALRLVHIVEYVPIEPMSDSLAPAVQVDDRVLEHARQQLRELAAAAGVAADCAQVISRQRQGRDRCARRANSAPT